MARFKFTLDAVLKQRKLVEDQKQRAFGEVQRRYAAMEAELRAMDDEVKRATEDLRDNHLVGRISVDYLAAHRRFTMAMQRKALAHAERMSPVKAELEAARAALIEAAKQRKILEKLREKREADWKVAEARKDAAAMDEIGQQIGTRLARAAGEGDAGSGADQAASPEADEPWGDRDALVTAP
ncbi:MAG TPA: flagellar export protein FliJ [Humisphaera sp.]